MRSVGRIVLVGVIALAIVIVIAAIWIYRQLDQETIGLGHTEGELVFMSDRDGDWDIYLMDKAGDLHNLTTESDAHEYYPNFTFNGQQVSLFSTQTGDVTPARVNVDGTGFKTQTILEVMLDVVAEGNTDWDPVWAPGGEKMAWNKVVPSLPLPRVDLFAAHSDGSNRIQLTSDSALEFMHNWSPDGTQLVYTSDSSGKQNTYLVDAAGTTITRLTEHDLNDYQPSWSMDGSQVLLIFSANVSMLDGVMEFHLMNADGSDLHPMAEDEVFEGDMAHSPYGGQVAYMSNADGYWHIYLMDADGSNVKRLTDGESNNLFPSWRPVPADQQAEGAGE